MGDLLQHHFNFTVTQDQHGLSTKDAMLFLNQLVHHLNTAQDTETCVFVHLKGYIVGHCLTDHYGNAFDLKYCLKMFSKLLQRPLIFFISTMPINSLSTKMTTKETVDDGLEGWTLYFVRHNFFLLLNYTSPFLVPPLETCDFNLTVVYNDTKDMSSTILGDELQVNTC